MKNTQNYTERIIVDPKILAGKPVIKGTRVPVELVLQYLANDPDIKSILAAFPHLTVEDIKACLSYAQELVEEEQELSIPGNHIANQAHL